MSALCYLGIDPITPLKLAVLRADQEGLAYLLKVHQDAMKQYNDGTQEEEA